MGAMVHSVFTQEGIYSNLLIISTSRHENQISQITQDYLK